MLITPLFLLILFGDKILLQVNCKRYDNSQIVELPGSTVEVKAASCEFNCDKDCALDQNCVATNLWKNGTCLIVHYGGVTLKVDPNSEAKTRGI